MSWRDQLQPGSYNNVALSFESDEATFGRRTQVHEYPAQDTPFVEDLGRGKRGFRLECFLLGDDFMRRRDALIAELEKPGPGTLVHPYYGSLRVSLAEPGRVGHSSREGGMCTVTLAFVEAGEREFPSVAADTVQQLGSVANLSVESIEQSFSHAVTSGHPGFVFDGLVANLQSGLSALSQLNGQINSGAAPISTVASTIDSLGDNIVSLLQSPRALAGQIAGVIGSIFSNSQQVDDALRGFYSVRDNVNAYDTVPTTTPSRVQQNANQLLAAQLFRGVALVETVRAVSQLSARVSITDNAQSPFGSRDQAETVRDQLLDELDAETLLADDDVYKSLIDVQRRFVSHINAHGQTLSRIAYKSLFAGVPSLVFAHQLYGNIDLELDIVKRNNIRRPAQLPTRQRLEYLSAS